MAATAVALVLLAALLHAVWNLILARSSDTVAAMCVAMLAGSVVVLPFAVLRWRVEAAALPWVAVSSALELAYFVLLARAYSRADLSLVYPVARGLAPVFVLVGSVVVFGRSAGMVSGIGVVTVAIGVMLVRGIRSPAAWADVLLAVTIATLIAGYTLADQQGVAHADPVAYLVLVIGIPGLVLAGWFVTRAGGVARLRRAVGVGPVVGGGAVAVAYGFILAALAQAPAPAVAALRETSIVMATVLAAVVLHERVERARWLGCVVVVAGIALVVSG
ncbi:MAG: EamA family transporter [Chloroflexi bacterium]|nr:EamA family transporter [Chloroflexota bacterium]